MYDFSTHLSTKAKAVIMVRRLLLGPEPSPGLHLEATLLGAVHTSLSQGFTFLGILGYFCVWNDLNNQHILPKKYSPRKKLPRQNFDILTWVICFKKKSTLLNNSRTCSSEDYLVKEKTLTWRASWHLGFFALNP